MENKNLAITHAYHFFSEAIIVFLIIHPFMFSHYQGIPYMVYIGFSLLIGIVFALFEHYQLKYTPYLISFPIMFVVFYLIGYPISLSLIFSVVLVWRYLAIRSELYLKREEFYLIFTLLFTIGIIIFTKDLQVILLLFVMLLVLVIGNILSHLLVIDKKDQQSFNKKFWITFGGVFSLFTLVIYASSDGLRFLFVKIYNLFGDVLVLTAGGVASIFGDFNPDDHKREEFDMASTEMNEEDLDMTSYLEVVGALVGSYFGLSLLIAVLVLLGIFIYLLYRSRVKFREEEEVEDLEYTNIENRLRAGSSYNKGLKRRRKRKVSHPIRRIIYDFERKAAKHDMGRRPFETLEEWLERIGFTSDLNVYQKVRYAGMEVSSDERNDLVNEIKRMERKFKDKP